MKKPAPVVAYRRRESRESTATVLISTYRLSLSDSKDAPSLRDRKIPPSSTPTYLVDGSCGSKAIERTCGICGGGGNVQRSRPGIFRKPSDSLKTRPRSSLRNRRACEVPMNTRSLTAGDDATDQTSSSRASGGVTSVQVRPPSVERASVPLPRICS